MTVPSFWILPLSVERLVRGSLTGRQGWSREEFLAHVASSWIDLGLAGIDEGTVLSPDADALGEGTESWTLDAGVAPRERDWVEAQTLTEVQLYFPTQDQAQEGASRAREFTGVTVKDVFEQVPQDWDAQWKAAFLKNPEGVRVPPDWRILPPWVSDAEAHIGPGERVLRINPGAGFGTGTHETSQLCLQALAEQLSKRPSGTEVLDFGSGSGILSIAAALLGARVLGVEIDELANDNARDNARLNQVDERVSFQPGFSSGDEGRYQLAVANILRPILVQFAPDVVSRLMKGGVLILSGLIEEDLPEVIQTYSTLLRGRQPEVRRLGEWRCLLWV